MERSTSSSQPLQSPQSYQDSHLSRNYHAALHTPLVDILGCEYPVLLAGMGGVSRHELAAAVSNAGGFGCLGMVREPSALIRREVEAYRALSHRPFAVNIIPASTDRTALKEQVATCLSLKVPAMTLFWDVDKDLVRHLKAEGMLVLHQVGTLKAAEDALNAGVDAIIVQGVEAGGHIHGLTSIMGLLPEVVAMSTVPVIASGGVASGNALVATLALGAQGVSCGAAFLATHESYAHTHHKERIVKAHADDTLISHQFFRNWTIPAAVRILNNAVTRGEYQAEYDARQTPVIAEQDGGPVYLFATDSPLRDGTGKLDDMPIYAGQSCGQIHDIVSAAERVHQIMAEASACLDRLSGIVSPSKPVPPKTATTKPAATEITSKDSDFSSTALLVRELMAAERAGARIMAMSLQQAGNKKHRDILQQLHRGEAESCRRLRACHVHLGMALDHDIGDFYQKCMAISDMDERLALVARGQRWVARKIREYLPSCPDDFIRHQFRAILQLHEEQYEEKQA